jgi:succinate dehydrogenase / fumarate reductase iron-sulfur subunit
MVINGRERLACKTVVGDLPEKMITIRPLNHFPVIKDLVVDMEPFFKAYEESIPYFAPETETDEPAVIRPDSTERMDIGLSTECIACGCCVSSCTMVNQHEDYAGPAALNRAFTLLADSRDGLRRERMEAVVDSCYNCRLEFNCTEVCPKEISPTRAIKYIQRKAVSDAFRKKPKAPSVKPVPILTQEKDVDLSRRKFLAGATYGIGIGAAFCVGGILASAAVGPTLKTRPRQWIDIGELDLFTPGKIKSIDTSYSVLSGFYRQRVEQPVMVLRRENEIVVYNSRCTHLGCQVHWDEGKGLFLCACHGGAFDIDGNVKAGPPPRPLDRYSYRLESGRLLIEV